VEFTRTFKKVINQPLSHESTRIYLKRPGMKAMVKKKKPLFSARHMGVRMDFALALED
jgi:hypothetical protein